MAFAPSPATIVGIALGGFVLIVVPGIFLIAIVQRQKHKRLLARTNAVNERRLSRYTGGHMSITDEDVARMPGTSVAVRRSLRRPYPRATPYEPMASRETLHHQDQLMHISRAAMTKCTDQAPVVPQKSWPLPRRMTRSNGIPLVQLQALSPGTERMRTMLKTSPTKEQARGSIELPSKPGSESPSEVEGNGKVNSLMESPCASWTPKPLFHGHRSISYNMITKPSQNPREISESHASEPKDSKPKIIDRHRFTRSISLCSQEPGLAPTQPIPPLPFEIAQKRSTKLRNPTILSLERGSGATFLSENTSILDDVSRILSQADTDFSSIGRIRPTPDTGNKELGIHEDHRAPPEFSKDDAMPNPVGASRPSAYMPKLGSQRSFRASMQGSLPRSKSSGLSLSMSLHGQSRAESRTSLSNEVAGTHSKQTLEVLGSGERRRPRRAVSPSSPLRYDTIFDNDTDVKNKRASTSILQAISGNEGSPASETWNNRPSSIATSDPLQWDPLTSMQSGKVFARTGKRRGHRRQNCVRISIDRMLIPSMPSPKPPPIDEQEETSEGYFSTAKEETKKRTIFHPPSRSMFDPQITPTPRARASQTGIQLPNTPTLSVEEDSEFKTLADTPTRKPSLRKFSGAHPNRHRTILNPPVPRWPFPTTSDTDMTQIQSPTSTYTEKSNVFRLSAALISQASTDSCAPSLMFKFPSPPQTLLQNLLLESPQKEAPLTSPLRPTVPHRRKPESPIRGPRTPPSSLRPPNRRGSQRRGINKGDRSSPYRDRTQSVLGLRRMNSEANNAEIRSEHKRHLSLGGNMSEDTGKMVGREGIGGPRVMPTPLERRGARERSATLGVGVTLSGRASMYDAEGFLREVG